MLPTHYPFVLELRQLDLSRLSTVRKGTKHDGYRGSRARLVYDVIENLRVFMLVEYAIQTKTRIDQRYQ